MSRFCSFLLALAYLPFMFQGVAARPCTAVVRLDPTPPQLKPSSLSTTGNAFVVKASCNDETNRTQDLAYDGLYYSTPTPELHELPPDLTISGTRLLYGGPYVSKPTLVIVFHDMVADYLAAAALSESMMASDPGIDVALERSLYRSSDGEYASHGGQVIRASSDLGRRQFGEAEYPYQDVFHVLIRAPLTSSAPWISVEEYESAISFSSDNVVAMRDGAVSCLNSHGSSPADVCVQHRPVGPAPAGRVRYTLYEHIPLRVPGRRLLTPEAVYEVLSGSGEAVELYMPSKQMQVGPASSVLPMNLIPSNHTARIAVPDAQYKLAVVHASTGETLATTSAMSTSPQPAVDVAIVYRSQYTESSLVEEVRAVLDAAGMSYDLVDISRVSLAELVVRTDSSMARDVLLMPTAATGQMDDAVFAALVVNDVAPLLYTLDFVGFGVWSLSLVSVLPDVSSLPAFLIARLERSDTDRDQAQTTFAQMVHVLQQPQHQIVPVTRLMRHARGQPVYGGYTPGDPTRTQLIAAISKRMGYSEYLEIGCEHDRTFQHIHLDRVVGVDPAQGGNVRLPSDDYFVSYHGPQLETYFAWRSQHLPDTPTLHLTAMEATKYDVTDPAVWGSFLVDRSVGEVRSGGSVVGGVSDVRAGGSFDIVFVDGLHEWKQALRDVEHALAVLKPNGTIVVHDLSARTEFEAMTPQMPSVGFWNGDTWRAGVALRARPDLDMVTSSFDHGCGVIRARPNTNQLILPEPDTYATMTWEELDAQREAILRIRGWDEIMAWL